MLRPRCCLWTGGFPSLGFPPVWCRWCSPPPPPPPPPLRSITLFSLSAQPVHLTQFSKFHYIYTPHDPLYTYRRIHETISMDSLSYTSFRLYIHKYARPCYYRITTKDVNFTGKCKLTYISPSIFFSGKFFRLLLYPKKFTALRD